ncbi:Gfo/Idh/MocA family protein [Actinotalea ferrariae]|uniref:Gfo/Idh/MocA family protein n=1 Tax=Actinotalea ferrariae TaxID=1386098 RepID=UPI0027E0EF45|nr:Gfo/Idh/MocA family oxidoreductase [Actinotalea ferrariae]
MPDLPRVALVGIHGYGVHQRRAIEEHEAAGRARLVGLADPVPPDDPSDGAPQTAVPWFPDLRTMLDTARPDVVVVATPIHTHTDLATLALRAGCDVLLEKPPTASLEELDRLLGTVAETGREVQVGFQTFGSAALDVIHDAVAAGELGEVRSVDVVGTWVRPESYFTRSEWAGRRTLGGRAVVDGVVTNPLAHAVAAALHLAGARTTDDVVSVELDQYRANDIEADDTSAVRVVTSGGVRVVLGLTLCAATHSVPTVTVRGTAGTATLDYYADTVTFRTADGERTVAAERTHLLTNLLDHRDDPSVPLLSPLRGTGAFMRVLDAVRAAPDPTPVPAEHVERVTDDAGTHRVVHDVEAWCARVAAEGRTFAELGAPWARGQVHASATHPSAHASDAPRPDLEDRA